MAGTAVWLSGCSKTNSDQGVASVSIPEKLMASEPFAPEKFLAGISIEPEGTVLTSRELLYVSSFFQQTLARAQADGRKSVELPKTTNVFKSLDASLKNTPGWSEISNGEAVDLGALVQFIEKTHVVNDPHKPTKAR